MNAIETNSDNKLRIRAYLVTIINPNPKLII